MNNNIIGLSLKRNFSWTLTSNIIYAITQWGMLTVIAKFGNPAMVGQYTLGLAVTAPIIMLTNLQLRSALATDSKDEFDFWEYFNLRIISLFIYLIIITVIIIFTGYKLNTSIIIILVAIAKLFEAISDILFGVMQKHERMDIVAKSKLLKGLLSFVVFSLVLIFTENLFFGVISLALTWLFILLIYDFPKVFLFISLKTFKINKKSILYLLKLTIPLGLAHMLGSLNTNIPRYIMERYMGEEYLGYFAAMAYIIVAGNTVIGALGQVVTPRLAKYFSKNNIKEFNKLILNLVLFSTIFGLFICLLTILYGDFILSILYTPEYAKYQDVFVLIMISAAIMYMGSFIGYGITATRQFFIQSTISVLWVVSSIIISFLLIPKYGLIGGAYTLIGSSLVIFFSRLYVLVYIVQKGKQVKRDIGIKG
jgi:O-antigen/teichoic acid export membrane protein